VNDGWTAINGAIAVAARRIVTPGPPEDVFEEFEDEPERAEALEAWKQRWVEWQARNRPAWEARQLYDRLFELHAALERDLGSVEAIAADVHLTWQGATRGPLDHPLLARRMKVEFDPDTPLIRVIDLPEAPTEFLSRVLVGEPEVAETALRGLQEGLREDRVHPFSPDAVQAWGRRVVQTLWVDGRFESGVPDDPGPRPVVSPRPVLLMRSRGADLAEVLTEVVDQIGAGSDLPASLVQIVGGTAVARPGVTLGSGGWSTVAPPEVLFGKAANREQLKLVQELDRHDAVLVQGPPGTGKSHTIANLIGHLTAQGKTVLVTSQKGKALNVLKGHLISALQPLAVSVIKEEGSKPLKNAASALLEGMAQTQDELSAEDVRLTSLRSDLHAMIEKLTREILACVQGEYREIRTGYTPLRPAEAAKRLVEEVGRSDWLPGPLSPETASPLTPEETDRLYHLTASIDPEVEAAIEDGVPAVTDLPTLSDFSALLEQERAFDVAGASWDQWTTPLPEDAAAHRRHEDACRSALGRVTRLRQELAALEPWEEPLLDVALRAEGTPPWLNQAVESIATWHDLVRSERQVRIDHEVVLRPGTDPQRLEDLLSKEVAKLGGSSHISQWRRLFNGDAKEVMASATVNGHPPMSSRELELVRKVLHFSGQRRQHARQWAELVPGGPALPDDEGQSLALRRRLEHRAGLAPEWFALRAELPPTLGLSPSALDRAGAPGIESLPLLREVRRLVAGLETMLQDRLQGLKSRAASMLLAEAISQLQAGPTQLAREAARILHARDLPSYERFLAIRVELERQEALVSERKRLLGRLRPTAPGWAEALRTRADGHNDGVCPGPVIEAWIYRQAAEELERRHAVDLDQLQVDLRECQQQLLEITSRLIATRTWQHLLQDRLPRNKQDLLTYTQLMHRYGKGTGKLAWQLLRQARTHLEQARRAVPIWIMPMDRVFESFRPESQLFDVVIVDEASQCDLTGLLAYYIARKVVVVGDHEQVQPSAVGMDLDTTEELRQSYLYDVPGSALFRPDTSIYDFARTSFGGQLMLREHFRCVPDIIAFSNGLSYDGEIRALRPASAAPAPHVVEHVVPRLSLGDRDKTNVAEALWIVALVTAMTEHSRYRDRSIGVVSLLYAEQVKELESAMLKHVPAALLARHNIVCGSPSQFQGDERDVMLLSMVSRPSGGPQRLLSEHIFKSRFNVAASRARDQLWVVHSLDPEIDLKEGDLRRALIKHVRDPGALRRVYEEKAEQAESPFEKEVLRRLIDAGFEVTPQHQVGFYRIDIVVWDGDRRLAIECDGERYHTLDDLPRDLARQATLERLGWTFVRIRGSQWYGDRDAAWRWLKDKLARHEIAPRDADLPGHAEPGGEVEYQLLGRARELLAEWGHGDLVPPVEPVAPVVLGDQQAVDPEPHLPEA